MDKTIIASFEDMDMATNATIAVTEHIDNIKNIRVANQGNLENNYDYNNNNVIATATLNNGFFADGMASSQYSAAPVAIVRQGNEYNNVEIPKKSKVEIITDESNVRKISSTLRNYGGQHIIIQ